MLPRARSRALLAAVSLVVSAVIVTGARPEAGAVATQAAAPRLTVTPRIVVPRQTFTLSGRLRTQVVREVVLETRVNGRWRSAKIAQTKPNGTFRFKARAPQRLGTVVLRVGAPETRIQGRKFRPITTRKVALTVRSSMLTTRPSPTATLTTTPTVRPTPVATATGTPSKIATAKP